MSAIGRTRFFTQLTTDKVLGLAGGGLAAASLGFGVYMNIHGPVAGFGTSKDFTVFAQLAPRRQARRPRSDMPQSAKPQASPADVADQSLDMTATASIAKLRTAAVGSEGVRREPETGLIPSVTLETASSDSATIAIDGRAATVRVGDIVPGAGEVLEIRPGRHAVVRTSHGFILSSQRD